MREGAKLGEIVNRGDKEMLFFGPWKYEGDDKVELAGGQDVPGLRPILGVVVPRAVDWSLPTLTSVCPGLIM